MTGRLQDRVTIVTGAGSVGPGWGNGRAIAVYFAREGAKILAIDTDDEALATTVEQIRTEGGLVEPLHCDVTDESQIRAMVEHCLSRFERIDILVNNVGGSRAGGPVDLVEEDWQRQLDVNLTSVYLGCRHVIPVMEAQKSGVIINISSASGMRYTGAPQVGYAAAKAAVIQLSKVVAVQYAKSGIRVNTIVPGQLHTPMVEVRLAGQRAGGDVDALLAQRQRRIPIPFMGDGTDTAWAAVYLASDEARFVTATEIVVDGGMVARCD